MSKLESINPSPAQARDAAQRLINSHFGNANRARTHVPVQPDDDDVVVVDYISQSAHKLAAFDEMIAALDRAQEVLQIVRANYENRGDHYDGWATQALPVIDRALAKARGEA